MKPKGEISSVDCGAIQNNVNSLLLGIETLCFGAVTLRDDSAKGARLNMILSCSWVMVMR